MVTQQESHQISFAPLPFIIRILQEIEDPRVQRTRTHHLADIIFISLRAVIYGGESFEDMVDFGTA